MMTVHRNRKSVALAPIVIALLLVGGASSAGVSGQGGSSTLGGEKPDSIPPQVVAENPNAEWFAVRPDGEYIASTDVMVDLIPEPAASPGDVTPYLIDDPVAWSACFVVHDIDYKLATYTYYAPTQAMTISLECGQHFANTQTGFGWWHIQARHEQEWRDRLIQVGANATGDGWDDFMSWAVETSVGWPMKDVPRGSNNTRCVSAPILMYDAQGQYAFTFNPSIVIGINTARVITASATSTTFC